MFPHKLDFLGLQPTLWSVCLCTERCLQRNEKRHLLKSQFKAWDWDHKVPV